METITLKKKDIYTGNLILVNKLYPLKNSREENKLSLVPLNHKYKDTLLEMKTANMLEHLVNELKCDEDIVPVSGYRSYEEQKNIYVDSLKNNGKDFTEKFVAVPNHSEHQTGLAIDLALKQDNIDFICPNFPYDGICNVFRKKALDYGFVERYEKGKEAITGIAHEPWHFRFVGYPHSKIMNEYGLSLEEYIDFIRQFQYENRFKIKSGNKTIEIFYENMSSQMKTIDLPDKVCHLISGNNVDGFIITLWGNNL
ncbi:D-alanyl-D-alanine carboxypeptidase family protein [Vallitalea guaymasensis]|uniref:D-alanyl-D-alanine carboxypeptidase family protein n=1 Tax=Vallitalea guaymasensis TaxID=1185412 RepID=UPI000DE2CD93|nr:D-alanyl-D-alanine carboxypeptidase family protein [Vallitalea guaymasensis]